MKTQTRSKLMPHSKSTTISNYEFQSGRRVWLPDKAAVWRIAEVVSESADGSSYTVLAKDGKRETEASNYSI